MPEPRPHILFLTRWYPNRFDPMPGLFIRRHATAVAAMADVTVLYVHPSDCKTVKSSEVEHTTSGNFEEYIIYYPVLKPAIPGVQLLRAIHYYIHLYRGMRLIFRNRRPASLIHVNILTRLGLFALLVKTFMRIPYIVTEHWSRYLPITNTYRGLIRKMLTKRVACKAGAMTAVTYNLKRAMEYHGIRNPDFEVVPNVVEHNFFEPPLNQENTKTLLHVSCFEDRSKNISGLLRAVASLARIRSDFRLLLVGEGQDLEQMKTYANQLQLGKWVTFTGLAEGGELLRLYHAACCLVMFSNYENMPVVINESLACGKPVIATAVGGIPEVIDTSRGILVPPGDEEALYRAMDTMLDHAFSYDATAIREYALSMFSQDVIGARFMEIYQQVLRKQP